SSPTARSITAPRSIPHSLPPRKGDDMSPDQARFKALTKEVMDNPSKKGAHREEPIRLRKNTFLQRLVRTRKPERVLFITFRQTLARDIMRNFGNLNFKNYLDSHDDPSVWNASPHCPVG
ncbi:MAG: hypothetical protein ACKPKO_16805, partial [Candidatus Fonsibacter sp.]